MLTLFFFFSPRNSRKSEISHYSYLGSHGEQESETSLPTPLTNVRRRVSAQQDREATFHAQPAILCSYFLGEQFTNNLIGLNQPPQGTGKQSPEKGGIWNHLRPFLTHWLCRVSAGKRMGEKVTGRVVCGPQKLGILKRKRQLNFRPIIKGLCRIEENWGN